MPDAVTGLLLLFTFVIVGCLAMPYVEHFYGVTVPAVARRLRRRRDTDTTSEENERG